MALILYPITIQIALPKTTLRLTQSFASYLKLSPKSKNPREPTANEPHFFFSITANSSGGCINYFGSKWKKHFLTELMSQQWASLVAQMVKTLPAVWEIWVRSLGREESLEEGMTTHFSMLAWRIPWPVEPDGLQSMGSQRVRHD